jgi:fused signal recognition particle receptor
MFGFLKKKLNDLLKKSEEVVEKPIEKTEVKEKIIIKEEKKEEKTPESVDESIKEYHSEEKKEEREEKLKKIDEEEKAQVSKEKKQGFFSKLAKGFTSMKLTEESYDDFFNELELILIENNVAMEAIDSSRKKLKEKLIGKEVKKKEVEHIIKESLKESISELLIEPFDLIKKIEEYKKNQEKSSEKEKQPYVIVFFGINGSGKTTTIARLAFMLKKKFSVILAASDTFRAASIEQLEMHAKKLELEIVKSKYGADPASVAFDAIAHAKANDIDVVLIDTAGRMHNKADLLREMEKIVRVSKPDLKIFVAESTTGNDAVEQAKSFNESIGIDALILTKADVDERGGAMISASFVTGKPILFLGVGQEYKDLEIFNKKKILDKLFG